MSGTPWRGEPNFGRLCDLVASDRLVCLTGAGISLRLPRAADPAQTLPGWHKLLTELAGALGSRLPDRDRADCEALLDLREGPPAGRHLILAASILRAAAPAEFDDAFRAALTPRPGAYSATHAALAGLRPRGIVTFNYDSAHEAADAAPRAGGAEFPALVRLLPGDDAAIAGVLSRGLQDFFLLKAHESLDSGNELVLTQESYRHLLERSPAYKAFFQNLLTNFHFLVVGFGLDDPDFDLFVDAVVNQYGSPLSEHVVLRHRDEHGRKEVALRRRYGFHSLYVEAWDHLPELLQEAARTAGPRLAATIDRCLADEMALRSQGHRELARLGPAGRAVASASLAFRLDDLTAREDFFTLAEAAYSLGRIDPRANKPILLRIVDQARHIDPMARALTVLREALEPGDLPQLRSWRDRFATEQVPGPRPERLLAYLDYLLVYVDAKYRSFR